MNCLYTLDTKAMNHVLVNSYIYQKPEAARYSMSLVMGHGLLVVEEDKHKQQVHFPFGNLFLVVFTVLSAENYGNIHSFTTSCVVFLRLLTRILLLAQRKFEN
jgi:hypothetical protein